MKIPVFLWTTTAITKRIDALKAEQGHLTKELYRADLDALSRAAIDVRERALIRELIALQSERTKRGRKQAEALGLIKPRQEVKKS